MYDSGGKIGRGFVFSFQYPFLFILSPVSFCNICNIYTYIYITLHNKAVTIIQTILIDSKLLANS